LDRPALPIGTSRAGTRGGVFGHPQGRALRVAPFEVTRLLDATGRNIYDTSLVHREVVEMAAGLEPGDSGSPLVEPTGQVVGVTFAIARDRSSLAYALSTDELRAVLAAPRADVGTGVCIRS
jgi:S1-C subfamily serine protease